MIDLDMHASFFLNTDKQEKRTEGLEKVQEGR